MFAALPIAILSETEDVMKQYICIDIGGTSIKYGLISPDGEFLDTGERPTEAHMGGPAVLGKAVEIAQNYLSKGNAAGICVSTAGMVDCEKGEIIHAAPLIPGYTGTQIKKTMEETFYIPCEVENDVNCAGLAETFAGAARGTSSSLCLTIGTGIGGAIILNGQVLHGISNSACEVGYMSMDGSTFQDLGASSILVKKVAAKKGLSRGEVNGKMVFDMAKQGDPDCVQAIDEMAEVLGKGIANICYVINPEMVVLGGGIMAQKEYLYDRIKAALHRYLIPAVASKTKLAFTENQNQAGMLGAFYHFCAKHK